jgi:lipopolysaccharide/colanic/teichoic acid biosynthesis glycosyltransferase
LGDFLRFTSLDELPQLYNVIRGDMSLVGPRALPVDYLHLLSAEHNIRHSVRPGITGLAQVNGRHTLPWDAKFAFDMFYVNNISFALDVKILVRTFLILFSFRKDVSLLEKPFTGLPPQP